MTVHFSKAFEYRNVFLLLILMVLVGFVLLNLWFSVWYFVNHCLSVCTFLLIMVVSVLLRFTASECPFGVVILFL
jgi:hypothetical protein